MKKPSTTIPACLWTFFAMILIGTNCHAQEDIKKTIVALNSSIDDAVVRKDIASLTTWYGDDFVFTHGTGLVDSKQSWLTAIQKSSRFLSRLHDSTRVELHGDVALLTGTLTVEREDKEGIVRYALNYVRLFMLRQQRWQLVSHRTTKEWHLH